jgi:hypothetical protein
MPLLKGYILVISDKPVKVFISSVIGGMEQARAAAAGAVSTLGHHVIRAEDFGASSASPQQVCLAGVRAADAVILLLAERYGQPQASGLSPTHEEFREARDRCPVLVFVQHGLAREPAQQDFVDEVGAWASGYYRASYASPEELRDAVTRALHQLEPGVARGGADETEILARARQHYPSRGLAGRPTLCVVVAGGPTQSVLRPAELEKQELADWLLQQALFGPARIFDQRAGNRSAVRGHALELEQERAAMLLDEQGTIRILQPAIPETDPHARIGITSIIEEDVAERLQQAIRFAGAALDHLDGPRRLSDVVVVAGLLDAGYMPWRTRAEQAANPNEATMSMLGSRDVVPVELAPARRPRPALLQQPDRLAEDLTVLLGRQLRP